MKTRKASPARTKPMRLPAREFRQFCGATA
jgi:hypothetical protein